MASASAHINGLTTAPSTPRYGVEPGKVANQGLHCELRAPYVAHGAGGCVPDYYEIDFREVHTPRAETRLRSTTRWKIIGPSIWSTGVTALRLPRLPISFGIPTEGFASARTTGHHVPLPAGTHDQPMPELTGLEIRSTPGGNSRLITISKSPSRHAPKV